MEETSISPIIKSIVNLINNGIESGSIISVDDLQKFISTQNNIKININEGFVLNTKKIILPIAMEGTSLEFILALDDKNLKMNIKIVAN